MMKRYVKISNRKLSIIMINLLQIKYTPSQENTLLQMNGVVPLMKKVKEISQKIVLERDNMICTGKIFKKKREKGWYKITRST